MINMYEVSETNKMIESENLDVRTITLGISLLDCVDSDLDELNRKIYEKITTVAKDLVSTGKDIEKEFGIPIVNKRISITPVSLVGAAACKTPEDYVTIARTLDRAAESGCKLHWWILRTCVERNDTKRRESDPFNPAGTGRDRENL